MLSGSTSALKLDPGYLMYHYDTYQAWVGSPQGKPIPNPIPDPNYTEPSESAGSPPTFSNAVSAQDIGGCTAAVNTAIANGYAPPAVPFTLVANVNTFCYKPGIYKFDIKNLSNTTAILLEPGVYFFDKGLKMFGPLIGGYQADSPGVSLVFTEGSQCAGGPSACNFAGNNSPLIALNAGACITDSSISCTAGASPAMGWDGNPVEVVFTGPGTLKSPVPETLIVTKDPNCTVGTTEPSGCADTSNNVINLPGGGSLFVAGVQYAPTDNVSINGSSAGAGRIGQIIAWTVFYTGGSQISEFYPGGVGNGILRLDTACSGPGTICNPSRLDRGQPHRGCDRALGDLRFPSARACSRDVHVERMGLATGPKLRRYRGLCSPHVHQGPDRPIRGRWVGPSGARSPGGAHEARTGAAMARRASSAVPGPVETMAPELQRGAVAV